MFLKWQVIKMNRFIINYLVFCLKASDTAIEAAVVTFKHLAEDKMGIFILSDIESLSQSETPVLSLPTIRISFDLNLKSQILVDDFTVRRIILLLYLYSFIKESKSL